MNTSTEYAMKQFDEVLESAQNPSREASDVRQAWEGKPVEECIVAAREVLYEGLSPILRETLEPEQLAATHALFETVFEKTIQNQSGRSRSRSGNPS